ncbi:transcriptional regulator [Actinoplanes sp. OR16]|uniref:ArsR/SmtB family transcription factor n=1 Tax=Actinoplanes sp. OR16 TaxID=946334 RepID=UPI000F6DD706|nr:helix-turn-helix transcriptional regulator [Actinoplanes sp. OR16]BBH68596.1 transcriptional regulator [Actinoplanes sp. OR16]
MSSAEDLAAFAGLLADRTRAAICLALLDGRAWTAGELAAHAGVARSTATEHLNRLLGGGLLSEVRQGRHRYVRLAGPGVAQLLEDMTSALQPGPAPPRAPARGLGAITGTGPAPARGLKAITAAEALRRGRTCYDHLAGRLGIAVTDAMTARGLLDQTGGFALTAAGRRWFTGTLGLDVQAGTRPQARGCLDWTERRPHLAGVAGARLCEHFFASDWLIRIGSGRAVRLTAAGEIALRELLHVKDA